jgi:hypothetical protein
MSLPRSASILIRNSESEWRFDWSGFDGDDCFENYRVTITARGVARHFDFGRAVVWSLRWLNRFFADQKLEKTQGGLCVYRSGRDLRMVLEFDQAQQEFHLINPEVQLDREFLPRYDGEDET